MTDVEAVQQLKRELAIVGTKDRAEHEKLYQKSDWEFLGATVPQTRKVEKSFVKRRAIKSREDLLAVFHALWLEPVWELRTVAVLLLIRYAAFLSTDDLAMVHELVVECNGWCFNDMIGCHLLANMVRKDPKLLETIDKWALDDNLWIRRVAMQSLLRDLASGDLTHWPRFVSYARPLLGEKDFWTRKVIGWVCRETSKKNPDVVFDFLKSSNAKGLTLREGAKYLPSPQRQALGL